MSLNNIRMKRLFHANIYAMELMKVINLNSKQHITAWVRIVKTLFNPSRHSGCHIHHHHSIFKNSASCPQCI
jgi:hypothetical protein